MEEQIFKIIQRIRARELGENCDALSAEEITLHVVSFMLWFKLMDDIKYLEADRCFLPWPNKMKKSGGVYTLDELHNYWLSEVKNN
jgi:hypothetical protein